MNNARALPPLAKAVVVLIVLATVCTAVLVIIGSFAGVVALVRWMLSLLVICPSM